jgi:hypothetical protein
MTVEDYITKQTPEAGAILRWLQQIIYYAASGVREEVKWKVPFYTYRKQPLCYLNVLKMTKKGQPIRVDLAFLDGNDLPDEAGLLQSRGRRRIKSIGIEKEADWDEDLIRTYVQEALILIEKRYVPRG